MSDHTRHLLIGGLVIGTLAAAVAALIFFGLGG
jgi:hypothetical protein